MTDDEELGVTASTPMTELLRSVGVTDAEIAEASRHHHLELLAIESLVLPEATHHNITEIAAATGLSTTIIAQLWRSLGFVEPRPTDRIFTDADVDMLRAIGGLLDMGVIDDALTMQMARVIGSSLARVASAVIDSVDSVDPGDDEAARGLSRRDSEDFAGVAPLLLPTLLQVMDFVWRRHVQVAARSRMASEQAGTDPSHQVVGFADLVGFTALSQQLNTHELAAVVDRFEGIAYDTVGGLGGRVVKMIGDEVMFSIPHEPGAAEIALVLSETYRDDDELSDVRVGLAAGRVLQREADLFGPVVNLASRIVNIAFPGTVLCSAEIYASLEGNVEYGWKSIGQRNLKDIGRVPLYVLRRETAPVRDKTSREVAESRRAERREARVTEMADRRRRRRTDPLT
ncbi:MAG: adenylate cyclase regulatory domain-containing protein [Aquihabitans sp.]